MKMNLKKRLPIKYLARTGLSLCLGLVLLTACRSASSTIEVKAEIIPAPVIGEVVTLKIEALSEKFSGDGGIWITTFDGINLVNGNSQWYGPVKAGEPFSHGVSICVFQPGFTGIYVAASVIGKDIGETQLNIYSTITSAEIDPRSRYRQPPQGSTPTPTPEPVSVSPECAGDN
jgi:hypothetical protein